MAAFDKANVDVAEIDENELRETCLVLTGAEPARIWKLDNGGCAANYGSELKDGRRCVIKAVVGNDCVQLARSQLAVLKSLDGRRIAPKPMCQVAVACTTKDKRPASAVAMEFLSGKALNQAIRESLVSPVAGFAAIGTVLGRLHANSPEALSLSNALDLTDPRFLEIFVRVDQGLLEDQVKPHIRNWLLQERKLQEIRNILKTTASSNALKRGLLHGDPYSDNVMLLNPNSTSPDANFEARLIDWEDCSLGPLVYDLACALVGTAFHYFSPEEQAEERLALSAGDSTNDTSSAVNIISSAALTDTTKRNVTPPMQNAALRIDVLSKILETYAKARPGGLPHSEALALLDLMRVNALACCTYRWHTFSDQPAAYNEMKAIFNALQGPAADAITATALAVSAASSS